MAKKKFLLVANWKMNPKTPKEVGRFFAVCKKAQIPKNVDVVIAPPFPFLAYARPTKKIALGAQDVFWEPEGSYTGEVSGSMLKNIGVSHVIIGHSERRRYQGETDEVVNKKVHHAFKMKLTPIVCVGETSRDGDGAFFAVIKSQLTWALAKISRRDISRVVIAYEPIWAIGTGKPAKPGDANEAALFIKKIIADMHNSRTAKKVRVLYGGSIDPHNAASFLWEQEITGLLVGKESRDPKSFLNILQCSLLTS